MADQLLLGGDAPQIDCSYVLPEKPSNVKIAWNQAPFKMQGLEAAVGCPTVTACTVAEAQRGGMGSGEGKRPIQRPAHQAL